MTIKELRKSLGLSQPKLAKALAIGVSTVGAYEIGKIKPSQKVVDRIREVFNVDLTQAVEEAVEAVEAAAAALAAEAEAPVAQAVPAEAAPEAPAAAPAPAKKPAKPRKSVKAEKPAKAEKVEKAEKPAKAEKVEKAAKPAKKAAKPVIIIQSPLGGEITAEEILAKTGKVDRVYVKVDENAAYWVNGDQSGAVNLW